MAERAYDVGNCNWCVVLELKWGFCAAAGWMDGDGSVVFCKA